GKGSGEGGKKGRAASLLHPRIPAEVELDGKPALLTEGIQGKEFLLQRVLVEVREDRFHPPEDRRETVSQPGEFLQAPVRPARVEPQQAVESSRGRGRLLGQRRDVLGPGHYERRGDLRLLRVLLQEPQCRLY